MDLGDNHAPTTLPLGGGIWLGRNSKGMWRTFLHVGVGVGRVGEEYGRARPLFPFTEVLNVGWEARFGWARGTFSLV